MLDCGQCYDGRPAGSALWSCIVNILHGKLTLWRPYLPTGSWLGSNSWIGVIVCNTLIISDMRIVELETQWFCASKVPETGRRTAVRPVAYRRKADGVPPWGRWRYAEKPMTFRRKADGVPPKGRWRYAVRPARQWKNGNFCSILVTSLFKMTRNVWQYFVN